MKFSELPFEFQHLFLMQNYALVLACQIIVTGSGKAFNLKQVMEKILKTSLEDMPQPSESQLAALMVAIDKALEQKGQLDAETLMLFIREK